MWIKEDEQNASWLNKATPLDAADYAKFLQEPKDVIYPTKILRTAALTRQPFKETALKPASVERAISALKIMYTNISNLAHWRSSQANELSADIWQDAIHMPLGTTIEGASPGREIREMSGREAAGVAKNLLRRSS